MSVVQNWNRGKKQEYADRKEYSVDVALAYVPRADYIPHDPNS